MYEFILLNSLFPTKIFFLFIEPINVISNYHSWLLIDFSSVYVCFSCQADYDSPRCYPEPSELPMDEFSDCFEYSTQWSSPPCSPMLWDTPTSCEYAWRFEDVEFNLKQETDF